MNDSDIQVQAYSYFLAEAPELLQTIEREILTLPNEHTTAKVHNLMRALHTLKGAAANVGLGTIERIAHDFEDLTRVFYDLDVTIDVSIQTLLLAGYSELHECLNAQVNQYDVDEAAISDRIAAILAQLKLKLGDWSEADIALPTAIELGFDIVASIFETTIQEQIDEAIAVIATHDPSQILAVLHSVTDICSSLAESFELPGFLAINQAIIAAMSHHPTQLDTIALLAVVNLQQAQTDVLAGDRTLGGSICAELADLATPIAIVIPPVAAPSVQVTPQIDRPDQIEQIVSGEAELTAFQAFLISDKFRKRHEFSTDNQHLFNQVIRLCWDWFRQEIQPDRSELNLEILVMAEGLADLDYIHHWIGLLLQGVSTPSESLGEMLYQQSSLYLYRQCCIYQVIFAVAKYLASTGLHSQLTPEFLSELRSYLQHTVTIYKQLSPVTVSERGWIDRIILPHHWKSTPAMKSGEDLLLSEIWGRADFGKGHE
ncbi:Hpt domain-containing protein [Chamaesiphon sp.]|uniref:Hpt domain-containing protein n=1 Tax=Chamaesiphon sp. TaxID=2814140 RepID=UPI0035938F5C